MSIVAGDLTKRGTEETALVQENRSSGDIDSLAYPREAGDQNAGQRVRLIGRRNERRRILVKLAHRLLQKVLQVLRDECPLVARELKQPADAGGIRIPQSVAQGEIDGLSVLQHKVKGEIPLSLALRDPRGLRLGKLF